MGVYIKGMDATTEAVQKGWRSMRLIDADALIPMMKYSTTDNEIGVFPIRIGFNTIKRVIDEAPTIDAVEVVRCKDCKWAEKAILDDYCVECTIFHTSIMRHGYCSHGERREP